MKGERGEGKEGKRGEGKGGGGILYQSEKGLPPVQPLLEGGAVSGSRQALSGR